MRRPRRAPRSALGGLPAPSCAPVLAEPGAARAREGRCGQVPGPGPPLPCCPRDGGRPSAPGGPARRSESELQLSRDFGRGLADLSEFLPRASPPAARRPQSARCGPSAPAPRPPAPATPSRLGGLSGRTGAPTGTPTPDSGAAVSGRAAGGAAVRRWCQAGERRAPRRRVHGAGVSGRGRRALTFLGLTPNGGQREPQRGPSEWLACCASLGNFSEIRSPRPGPSPFRNETCLPCRRKAMTVS